MYAPAGTRPNENTPSSRLTVAKRVPTSSTRAPAIGAAVMASPDRAVHDAGASAGARYEHDLPRRRDHRLNRRTIQHLHDRLCGRDTRQGERDLAIESRQRRIVGETDASLPGDHRHDVAQRGVGDGECDWGGQHRGAAGGARREWNEGRTWCCVGWRLGDAGRGECSSESGSESRTE